MPENMDGNATLMKEYIPAEYHGEEYVKPWLEKPWDKGTAAEVFKKLVNAESLIGKRPAIPDPKTAKAEDLDKFFEQFRPEKPEDYDIPLDEKRAKPDEGFIKAVRQAFHAGKISKVQAGNFLKVIDEYGRAQQKAAADAQKRKDAEFDALARGYLGAENAATMDRVKKLIAEHAPAAAKAQVAKLDDTSLLIMAAVVDGIHKKYASEDDLGGKGKGSGGSGATGNGGVKERREEARKLMASKAYTNWQDPEHEATVARVSELYKEVAAAGA